MSTIGVTMVDRFATFKLRKLYTVLCSTFLFNFQLYTTLIDSKISIRLWEILNIITNLLPIIQNKLLTILAPQAILSTPQGIYDFKRDNSRLCINFLYLIGGFLGC